MPLHIRSLIAWLVNRIFSSLHARALSHATEDLDRVKTSVMNAIGDAEIRVTRVEGHHGNPIDVVEAVLDRENRIVEFFDRLGRDDLDTLRATLGARVDEGCNLFVKIDKQSAFKGDINLGAGDDVISVRIKVRAFPAKSDLAMDSVDKFLVSAMSKKSMTG